MMMISLRSTMFDTAGSGVGAIVFEQGSEQDWDGNLGGVRRQLQAATYRAGGVVFSEADARGNIVSIRP